MSRYTCFKKLSLWTDNCLMRFVMIKRIVILLALLVHVFLPGFLSPAGSAECEEKHERIFLDLVNQARKNPMAMISAIGLDPHQVLESRPELSALLNGSIEPLHPAPCLSCAANRNARQALEAYSAKESIFQEDMGERKTHSEGYISAVSGQAQGVIASRNYLSLEDAAWEVFANMLREELAPDGELVFLNPDYQEMGVGKALGSLNLKGRKLNSYVFQCSLALSAASYSEEVFLSLVNTARREPAAALEMAGLNPQEIKLLWGEAGWVLEQSLAPVARSNELEMAVPHIALDKFSEFYDDSYKLVGRDDIQAVTEKAREGKEVFFLQDAVVKCEHDTYHAAAKDIFLQLIYQEAMSSTGPRHILNPMISMTWISVDIMPGSDDCKELTFTYAGSSVSDEKRYVAGNVFAREESDYGWHDDYGLTGMRVKIVDADSGAKLNEVITGAGGFYQMKAPADKHLYVRLKDPYNDTVSFYQIGPGKKNQQAFFWTSTENPDVQELVRRF